MSEPINHHYLPVFYLRQWCNSDGKVIRFYKPHTRLVASAISPDNTGYEPLLYSLSGFPPERRQDLEKTFMGRFVDEPGSRALTVLMSAGIAGLTSELRTGWARFLTATRLRNPEMVTKIGEVALRNLAENLARDPEEYLTAKSPDDPDTPMEWIEKNSRPILENIGKIFLPGIIDNEKIGNHLINMHWSVIDVSASNYDLLTSDRPYIQTLGLSDITCVVAFPISPRMLFLATNDRTREQQVLRRGKSRLVKAVNHDIVAQAMRHVYGRSLSHKGFVEKRLGLHPPKDPLP